MQSRSKVKVELGSNLVVFHLDPVADLGRREGLGGGGGGGGGEGGVGWSEPPSALKTLLIAIIADWLLQFIVFKPQSTCSCNITHTSSKVTGLLVA